MKKYDYVIVIENDNCEEICATKRQVLKRAIELSKQGRHGYYFEYDLQADSMVEDSEVYF